MQTTVLITGATGYLGRPLSRQLVERRHRVLALARPGSAHKLAAGEPVIADIFAPRSYAGAIPVAATIVHLVGTAHPHPRKARQFVEVDLASVRTVLEAAAQAQVQHFIYVSVAHPAPLMHAYIEARCAAEQLIRASAIPATILRPWYVLGPGHRWPYLLQPFYWLLRQFPATRPDAERLVLVRLPEMIAALTFAVEHPVIGTRVLSVPDIRSFA